MNLAATLALARTSGNAPDPAECLGALQESTVYLCVPKRPDLQRTGFEPAFAIVRAGSRSVVVAAQPPSERFLFVFSNRVAADAWCERAAGFAAEPIQGAVAAEIAVAAGVVAVVLDPMDATVVIPRLALEWGPRRSLAPLTLPDALARWMEHPTDVALYEVATSLNDSVLYILVSPVRGSDAARQHLDPTLEWLVSVHGREIYCHDENGRKILPANTDRATVEGWRAGLECIAIDGPAAVEAAIAAGLDLGIQVGRQKCIALEPAELQEWPRRPLSASEW